MSHNRDGVEALVGMVHQIGLDAIDGDWLNEVVHHIVEKFKQKPHVESVEFNMEHPYGKGYVEYKVRPVFCVYEGAGIELSWAMAEAPFVGRKNIFVVEGELNV